MCSMNKLLISFAIWLVLWLPVAALGLIIVPLLLLLGWQGYDGWWGNKLYGTWGNGHATGFVFLAIRNPASNFGKFTLGLKAPKPAWAWYADTPNIRYGWQDVDDRTGYCKFQFNPFRWIKK